MRDRLFKKVYMDTQNVKSILPELNENSSLMRNIIDNPDKLMIDLDKNKINNNIEICEESIRQTYYLINGDPQNPNSYILSLNPPEEIESNKVCEDVCNNKINNESNDNMNFKHFICNGNNISDRFDKNDMYNTSNNVIQIKECESSNYLCKRKFSNEPRICKHCNRIFKYPSDLKKHEQIHTEEKKYICHHCGKCFRRQHQLSVHVRIHTGEKPYICNTCGMAFRHDSTLTMHNRTRHQHLKPFKCDVCEKQFGRLSHLRKHQKYVCATARRNINTIENKEKSTCDKCGNIYNNESELYNHSFTCESSIQTNQGINNINNSEGYSFISNNISQTYNHCERCDQVIE